MPTIANKHAALSYHVVTDDDISDAADVVGLGGLIVGSLSSDKPGHAGLLLEQITSLGKPVALIAFAASGDHERLYKLYRRHGFTTVVGSLMSFHPPKE